jgi:Cu+-exporting ATPase
MNKPTISAFTIAVVLIGWAFWVIGAKPSVVTGSVGAPTATIVDGKQLIDITAKGGYSPRVVVAKAGVPTILRVTTNGTFDCSASVVIPKLSYQKFLKSSGTEDIAISAEQAQGTLQGLCAMGMYNFQIKFE